MNERMTHLLKLDTFFHTHDARIMTHDASQIRTTHRVDLALETICKSIAKCPEHSQLCIDNEGGHFE